MVRNDGAEASGRTQQWRGGSEEDSTTAGSEEVDDSVGSR
jgi:hypothetical protein